MDGDRSPPGDDVRFCVVESFLRSGEGGPAVEVETIERRLAAADVAVVGEGAAVDRTPAVRAVLMAAGCDFRAAADPAEELVDRCTVGDAGAALLLDDGPTTESGRGLVAAGVLLGRAPTVFVRFTPLVDSGTGFLATLGAGLTAPLGLMPSSASVERRLLGVAAGLLGSAAMMASRYWC